MKFIDILITNNVFYCYNQILHRLHKMGWTWNSDHSLLGHKPVMLDINKPLRIMLMPDNKKVGVRNLIDDDLGFPSPPKRLEINVTMKSF